MKNSPVVNVTAPKRITKMQFGTLSTEEIQKFAELHVCSRELYTMPQKVPSTNGCLDPRMGISDKSSTCQTCRFASYIFEEYTVDFLKFSKKLSDCAGHFGYVQLELPVFHAGYFKHTLIILQCICKNCCRVLLSPADRKAYLARFSNPKMDAFAKAGLSKKVTETCKKASRCPYCGYANGRYLLTGYNAVCNTCR